MRKRWQDSSGMGNAGHVGCMRGSAGKHCAVPSWSLSSAVSSESVSPSPAIHACSSSYRLGPDRSTWPGARWPSRRFVGRGREGVHRTLLPAPAQIVITICTQVCQEAPAPSGSVPRSLLLEAAGWLHRVEMETVTISLPPLPSFRATSQAVSRGNGRNSSRCSLLFDCTAGSRGCGRGFIFSIWMQRVWAC